MEYQKLDPCAKYDWCKITTLSEIGMHEFIEEGMRSDISYVAKTYSKGNNKHIESYDYNDTKPSKYVTYWDANNLYPWAMSQYLPYDGFI